MGNASSEARPQLTLISSPLDQTVAPISPLEYDVEDGGGGGMSGERITRVEVRLDNIERKVDALEKKVDALPRWVVGTGIACLGIGLAITFGVIQLQAGWFQKNIDAHQKVSEVSLEEFRRASEAHMDEFRRDSDRNYDLALKALERSMGQPAQLPQAAQTEFPPQVLPDE